MFIPYSVPLTAEILRNYGTIGAKVYAMCPGQKTAPTIYTLTDDAYADGGLVFAPATSVNGSTLLELDPDDLRHTFLIANPSDYEALAEEAWNANPQTCLWALEDEPGAPVPPPPATPFPDPTF